MVFENDNAALFAAAQDVRNEWVLGVKGKVRHRLPGKTNTKLVTGARQMIDSQRK